MRLSIKKLFMIPMRPDRDYPKNKTNPELFEEQVARTPKKIALVYAKQSLSYHELNQEKRIN